ncbi:MAG: hypothetical protein ACYDIB_10685 [Desulfobulbia bacterium]
MQKKIRLYTGEGGKPSFYKTCDPVTCKQSPDKKQKTTQADERSGAKNNPHSCLGYLLSDRGVGFRFSKEGRVSDLYSRPCPGIRPDWNYLQHGCRDVFASHPPVTAEIHALVRARGPPVAINAPTKQATAHRPVRVESVPNTANAPVETLVFAASRATDLVRLLLFANDACVMIRLLFVG